MITVPDFREVPMQALAAELDMLYRALERTRQAQDARAEGAALRCISVIEMELAARDEEC